MSQSTFRIADVVEEKLINGRTYCRIRWYGCGPADDTFVLKKEINNELDTPTQVSVSSDSSDSDDNQRQSKRARVDYDDDEDEDEDSEDEDDEEVYTGRLDEVDLDSITRLDERIFPEWENPEEDDNLTLTSKIRASREIQAELLQFLQVYHTKKGARVEEWKERKVRLDDQLELLEEIYNERAAISSQDNSQQSLPPLTQRPAYAPSTPPTSPTSSELPENKYDNAEYSKWNISLLEAFFGSNCEDGVVTYKVEVEGWRSGTNSAILAWDRQLKIENGGKLTLKDGRDFAEHVGVIRKSIRLLVDGVDLLGGSSKDDIATFHSALFIRTGDSGKPDAERHIFRVPRLLKHNKEVAKGIAQAWRSHKVSAKRSPSYLKAKVNPDNKLKHGSEEDQEIQYSKKLAVVEERLDDHYNPASTKKWNYNNDAVYDLKNLYDQSLDLVDSELKTWDANVAIPSLYRVLDKFEDIGKRSKFVAESQFSKELLADNWILLRRLFYIINVHTDGNIHPSIVQLLSDVEILVNMSAMRSKPSIYALIMYSLIYTTFFNLVHPSTPLEEVYTKTWAFQHIILSELIAIADSMIVGATLDFHLAPSGRDTTINKAASLMRGIRESNFSCDSKNCSVDLESGYEVVNDEEVCVMKLDESMLPGTKARIFRSGGVFWREAMAVGPVRLDRYPCPDCLHRFGDADQLHAIWALVWRFLHRRCRHAEGKRNSGGGVV